MHRFKIFFVLVVVGMTWALVGCNPIELPEKNKTVSTVPAADSVSPLSPDTSPTPNTPNVPKTPDAHNTPPSSASDTISTPKVPSTPVLPPSSVETDNMTVYEVERFPQVRSLWRGFCLLYYERQSSHEREAVLLSLQEWTDVATAFSKKRPQQAQELAHGYQEQGLSNWHIPTTEEAEVLSDYFGDELELAELKELLDRVDSSPLLLEDEKGVKVAYLCDEGRKTFRFTGRKPSKAATNKNYRLRLLKHISLKLKSPSS